jgi:hypothetical protein
MQARALSNKLCIHDIFDILRDLNIAFDALHA